MTLDPKASKLMTIVCWTVFAFVVMMVVMIVLAFLRDVKEVVTKKDDKVCYTYEQMQEVAARTLQVYKALEGKLPTPSCFLKQGAKSFKLTATSTIDDINEAYSRIECVPGNISGGYQNAPWYKEMQERSNKKYKL